MKITSKTLSQLITSFVLMLVISINLAVAPAVFAQAPTSTPSPIPVNDPTDCKLDTATGKYFLNDDSTKPCIQVTSEALGFRIPNLTEILTFAIRAVFVFGGLAALFFLLLGAFSWITSGGDKEKVSAAQQKIQAAVIGVIMIAVVLAIVVTLEQVIFGGRICLGLSCPLTIPTLIKAN